MDKIIRKGGDLMIFFVNFAINITHHIHNTLLCFGKSDWS